MSRKPSSGIKRNGSRIIDRSKYEKPQEYKSTTLYSVEPVLDPNGRYIEEKTGKKFSIKETYAENLGFREMRRAPIGSMIVVHIPRQEFRLEGVIPAHDEYYEVTQRTKSIKSVEYRGTTDSKRRFITKYGVYYENRLGGGTGGDLTNIREIQARFKYAGRITIYKPK